MHAFNSPHRDDRLRVEIHTGTHLILGTVETRSRRLADLRDSLASPRLPVQDARVQPLEHAEGERYRREERLLVSRDDIRLCIPYGCAADSPQEEGDSERTSAHAALVSLRLSGMEIDGRVFVEQGQAAGDVLQREGGPFLALTDARIRYFDEAISLPFTAETVLVNRAHVQQVVPRDDADRPASRLRKLLIIAQA